MQNYNVIVVLTYPSNTSFSDISTVTVWFYRQQENVHARVRYMRIKLLVLMIR